MEENNMVIDPSQILKKYLVLDIEGEAAMVFMIMSLPDAGNFQMVEAVLQSNPTMRFVDKAEVGQVWNGTQYTAPA
jgi:hypothetical protein